MTPPSEQDDERWMGLALEQADLAFEAGEVPVGCVIVRGGRVLGRGHNRVETALEASAHAEMIALSAASATIGDWRLDGATVYVTVEPCLMCAGALLLARIERVVYGAPEPKFGALGSRIEIQAVPGWNHSYAVVSGVRAGEAGARMQAFFRSLRKDQSAERRSPDL